MLQALCQSRFREFSGNAERAVPHNGKLAVYFLHACETILLRYNFVGPFLHGLQGSASSILSKTYHLKGRRIESMADQSVEKKKPEAVTPWRPLHNAGDAVNLNP